MTKPRRYGTRLTSGERKFHRFVRSAAARAAIAQMGRNPQLRAFIGVDKALARSWTCGFKYALRMLGAGTTEELGSKIKTRDRAIGSHGFLCKPDWRSE